MEDFFYPSKKEERKKKIANRPSRYVKLAFSIHSCIGYSECVVGGGEAHKTGNRETDLRNRCVADPLMRKRSLIHPHRALALLWVSSWQHNVIATACPSSNCCRLLVQVYNVGATQLIRISDSSRRKSSRFAGMLQAIIIKSPLVIRMLLQIMMFIDVVGV
ncbi:hypothetical protein CDAR_381851 [Caerostris darwini]|uniref:Uncharacterized protein n=1 Tax=Caerostris darwini TaxID=1538125 RepID=A0AAV4V5I2_9ARAC|nr:hypothetical protein CDAR_381851 [Caerostris darwini]